MEPILELATRITSQVWFLHSLFPDKDWIDDEAIRGWRKKVAPWDNYSMLQILWDLSGKSEETTAPGSGNESLEEAEKAIKAINIRISALRAAKMLAEVSLVPAAVQVYPETFAASRGEPYITREELFERIAAWLLNAKLDDRVALAKKFLPEKRIALPEQSILQWEFFIEADIDGRAKEVDTQDSKPRHAARLWAHLRDNPDKKLRNLLDSRRLRYFCRRLGVAVPVSMVLRDELDEISLSRIKRLRRPEDMPKASAQIRAAAGVRPPLEIVQRQAFESNLFGVALSGGGIRSATFALGLLQGMADRNILPYIDILSTVSGGGYIGSWLISWIKRRGSVASVQESMRGSATELRRGNDCPERRTAPGDAPVPDKFALVTRNSDPEADHVRPIRLLRQYARYLAPRAGLLEADTWTIVATWARNTTLNFLILTAFLGAALLAPRIATFTLLHLHTFVQAAYPGWGFKAVVLLGGVLLLIGCWLIGWGNLATLVPHRTKHKKRGYDDSDVVKRILPLVLLGAFVAVALIWYSSAAGLKSILGACAFATIVLVGIGIVVVSSGYLRRDPVAQKPRKRFAWWWAFLHAALAVAGSAAVGWMLFYGLYSLAEILGRDTERGVWIAASAGVALMLVAIAWVVMMFIGLLGNDMADAQREWWGRMGAWLGLAIGAWFAICVICFFMPLWMTKLGLEAAAAGIGWGAVTAWGAKLAYSPKSGRNGADGKEGPLNAAVLNLAPAVFLVGMLSAVSYGLFWAIGWLVSKNSHLAFGTVAKQLYDRNAPFSLQRVVDYYWMLMYPGSLAPLYLALFLAGVCLLLAWRVDVNEFSMHNFYKNRLVRCYLGASRVRAHRAPNAFTGFDLEDDIRLSRFQFFDKSRPADMTIDCQPSYAGPFPILNTTLNVTQGIDLGLQERKAESFVFTPLWAGFDYSRRQTSVKKTVLSQYGFRQTKDFGQPENDGVFLGTAMAISGAAFNSNAGFHTSPTLAFLLTIFGVRLGWWAGNPRTPKWTVPSPKLGLIYLTKELTANTSTDSGFVLLSDGGHFENMGLYELIRRRCRYIIVSDAEEDKEFKLEGIGGAIRKCRVDFGVVIDLNIEALQPLGDPAASRLHYSLGTIMYPGEKDCGKLVYIKSSVTGDEPVDVIEFRKRHDDFPHTSTADQFFDESHFESYRALGQHVAQGIFTQDMRKVPVDSAAEIHQNVAKLFKRIEADWRKNLASIKKGKNGDGDK
jgi:hypothetical protein